MATYSIAATDVSQRFPKLKQGRIRIFSSVDIFYTVGEKATAVAGQSALLRAGQSLVLELPVDTYIAILQVSIPGTVTVTDLTEGTKASCSS